MAITRPTINQPQVNAFTEDLEPVRVICDFRDDGGGGYEISAVQYVSYSPTDRQTYRQIVEGATLDASIPGGIQTNIGAALGTTRELFEAITEALATRPLVS